MVYTDETCESRSKRTADKYATDMRVTDPAVREKVSTTYYNRSKRYGETKTKYASNTTGMRAWAQPCATAIQPPTPSLEVFKLTRPSINRTDRAAPTTARAAT